MRTLDVNMRSAFIADIRENYQEDAPRLIYADFLEDEGDSSRAEFVRLQCAIEKIREGCLCLACKKRRGDNHPIGALKTCVLQGKEMRPPLGRLAELEVENFKKWTGWPAFKTGEENWYRLEFRRGFLDYVEMTQADFLRNASALSRRVKDLGWPPVLLSEMNLVDCTPEGYSGAATAQLWCWRSRALSSAEINALPEVSNYVNPIISGWFQSGEFRLPNEEEDWRIQVYESDKEALADLNRACLLHLRAVSRG